MMDYIQKCASMNSCPNERSLMQKYQSTFISAQETFMLLEPFLYDVSLAYSYG